MVSHQSLPRETARQDRLLRITAAAEQFDVGEYTIRTWIREGRLRAVRVGSRSIRIRQADLDAMVTPVQTATTVGAS